MDGCIHTDDKRYTATEFAKLRPEALTDVITHATKTHPDALGKKIWDEKETVYWKQESDYEFLSDREQNGLVKAAFLEASMETPLVIRKRNKPTADAQIKVNWLGGKDVSSFKTNPSILAFAYGPSSGVGGDITMNADRLWLLRKTPLTALEAYQLGYITGYSDPNNEIKYYDPVHTMKHEGGHAIGMNHLTDTNLMNTSVMYPYYNGLRKFGTADKDYLHDLYGQISINEKIKEVILNRIFNFS